MSDHEGREWPVEEPFLSSLPQTNVRHLTGRVVESRGIQSIPVGDRRLKRSEVERFRADGVADWVIESLEDADAILEDVPGLAPTPRSHRYVGPAHQLEPKPRWWQRRPW
jgi:hypothetical protein